MMQQWPLEKNRKNREAQESWRDKMTLILVSLRHMLMLCGCTAKLCELRVNSLTSATASWMGYLHDDKMMDNLPQNNQDWKKHTWCR